MFDKHIAEFNKNIIGLREFVDLIDPFLSERHSEQNRKFNTVLMSGFINNLLATKKEWEIDEKEGYLKKKEELEAEIINIYKKPINVTVDFEMDENQFDQQEKQILKLSISAEKGIEKDILNYGKGKNHISILYKSSLISLLSSVEWFFSQILHYYYDKFPESTGIQKKTMTLSDLKNFGSIDDAEKYLIDSKIEEILRGSFDSWIALMKTDLSLKLGYLDIIENELIEIYQRRNLLVHNGGVVNSIYISKVKDTYRQNVNLNDVLDVDKIYLDNAICKLQKTFILIASELWKKLDKDDKIRGDVLSDIVYENLLKSRWDICEGLAYFIINDAQLQPTDKVVAQLNYWLCMKRTNRLDQVSKELEKADYSDKKEIFQLGLFALRNEKELFFEKLPIALDSRQLNIERLEEFPIFEEIRQTDEYEKFKSDSKYFKEPNIEIPRLDSVEKQQTDAVGITQFDAN